MRKWVRSDRHHCLTPEEQKHIDEYKLRKSAYHAKVWRLTEQVAHLIPGIEKRGWKDHHIDHIVPISKGFKNGVLEEVIADLSNLRMLPYKENLAKGPRSIKNIP